MNKTLTPEEILCRLRNPHGFDNWEMEQARHQAADMIEQLGCELNDALDQLAMETK